MKTLVVAALLVASAASSAFAQGMPDPCGGRGQQTCPKIAEPEPPLRPFSQQKWLKAPNSSADWSRDGMALPKIVGWPRQKVIALLGQPGMTEQEIDSDHDDDNHRFDIYRTTASNQTSITVAYDAKDKADRIESADVGCKCESCDASAPEIDMAKIKEFTAGPEFKARQSVTLMQADAALGRGGLDWGTHQVAGRYWVHYSETWAIEGQPHTFFRLYGYEATIDATHRDIRENHIRGGTYTSIQFWPECLP